MIELDYVEKKYWRLCLFEDGTVGAICNDGQLYMFEREDVEDKLSGLPKDRIGWFFNKTRDRYCAEWNGDRIAINPGKVVDLFGHAIAFND